MHEPVTMNTGLYSKEALELLKRREFDWGWSELLRAPSNEVILVFDSPEELLRFKKGLVDKRKAKKINRLGKEMVALLLNDDQLKAECDPAKIEALIARERELDPFKQAFIERELEEVQRLKDLRVGVRNQLWKLERKRKSDKFEILALQKEHRQLTWFISQILEAIQEVREEGKEIYDIEYIGG